MRKTRALALRHGAGGEPQVDLRERPAIHAPLEAGTVNQRLARAGGDFLAARG